MEYFNIYNKYGEKTQVKMERGEAHKTGCCHRVFHLWIINSQNQVLLQQRSSTKETGANLWYVSVGGHVEYNEGMEQAILRETLEELGLDISGIKEQIAYLFSFHEHAVVNENYIDNEIYDVFALRYDVPLAECKLQESEVQAVKYMDYADFKQALLTGDKRLVHHKTAYKMLAIALDAYLE